LRSSINVKIGIELDQRLTLFKSIFLSILGDIQYFEIHRNWSKLSIGDYEQSLFLNLIFSILRKYLIEQKRIKEIFIELLDEWKNSIKSGKFQIKFIIPMRNIIPENDIELLKDKLYIKAIRSLTLISKSTSSKVHNGILVYITEISFKIYTSIEEHNSKFIHYEEKFNIEWRKLMREIQEIIFSFYLSNIDFEYKGFIEDLPWWFDFDHKKYLEEKVYSSPEIILAKKIFEPIKYFYPKIVESKIFREENLIILSHYYMQIHNRDFLPDIILDAFILLEFLFSKESKEDIIFQMSFNAGLFLADNPDIFLDTFRLIKQAYGIRSALIHGDRWYDKLNDFLRKSPLINDSNTFINEIKQLINKILKKIIILKETHEEVLNDIKYLHKKSDKIKKVNYLQHLGMYYENKKEYTEALKMYIHALEITDNFNDQKKINELLVKIKENYGKNKNMIIRINELHNLIDELKIIIRIKGKKSEISKKILSDLDKLHKISSREKEQQTGEGLSLAIDGKDIMNILKVDSSPKVGQIKQLIIEKISKGELKNQRKDLVSFLKAERKKETS
jgi:hypothetical protein